MSKTVRESAAAVRDASRRLARSAPEVRNQALLEMGHELEQSREIIFRANQEDLKAARQAGRKESEIQRLTFGEKKLHDVMQGLHDLSLMEDPLGRVVFTTEMAPGLILRRVTCPLGVIGAIFEARPDALVQIASLCLKSGNGVLLKGGSEAARTNGAIFEALCRGSVRAGIPEGWAALLESREDVREMLRQHDLIDLVIPRGSGALVRFVQENTSIPVLGHSEGVCHIYLDASADPEMAAQIVRDAKCQYPAACNAVETVLVHYTAREALLRTGRALAEEGVILHADSFCRMLLELDGVECVPLLEGDLRREYSSREMNLRVVASLEEAIGLINTNGSHHTEAIVTQSMEARDRFFAMVDSAGVYHNCSTRFADGFRYGFGAEVGISTGKVHARGPVGLEGLCSYKYLLEGQGDLVGSFASGERHFTHRRL